MSKFTSDVGSAIIAMVILFVVGVSLIVYGIFKLTSVV